MKILYQIKSPEVNAAERWIFEAWRDGFSALGHQVDILTADNNLNDRLCEYSPDLFMCDICSIDLSRDMLAISSARARGTKVAVWVHWPLTKSAAHNEKLLREEDVADVYFGEREADHEAFFRDTGKAYVCIPHAASPKSHIPTEPDEQYASDILYIGTRLPLKRWLEENVINELRKDPKLKVLVIGMGWDRLDLVKRIVKRFCITLGLRSIADSLDRSTVKIPPDLERFYYASAKICLNFHERDPNGQQSHYIINQRTFKIPACSGLEICDDVPAIRKHFSEDEIVLLPLDRQLWLSKIYQLLIDDTERERIRANGTQRALRDHYSPARCRLLLRLAGLDPKDVSL